MLNKAGHLKILKEEVEEIDSREKTARGKERESERQQTHGGAI